MAKTKDQTKPVNPRAPVHPYGSAFIGISVGAPLNDRFRAQCRKLGRTISSCAQEAMETWLNKQDADNA